MDTLSIINVISQYQRCNIFKGVFPCNLLPLKFSLPAIFVINLSPDDEPGSYWVAVYISANRCAFYFDSFGLPVKNSFIMRFLTANTVRINYNKSQIQHITSKKCGQFCCVFAVSILKNCTINSFLSKFCQNLFVNDIVIENMYNYLKKK